MQNSLKKIIFEMQFLHRKCSDANAFHLFSKGRCFLKDRRTKCLIQMPNYHKKYEILIRNTHSSIDFLRKSRNGSVYYFHSPTISRDNLSEIATVTF